MSDPLASGNRLGPYQLLGTLGRGGMGEVYRARDLRLGRVVALKVVGEGLAGQEAAERQLIIEARATATLSHPNVVTLYDVGADCGRVWAALEYVEGQTLAERLAAGRLPHGEALRIARAVAHGLAAAHAAGIVHRDLKPTNVLLGTDGRPRILDFGIARALRAFDVDERTSPLVVATPAHDDSFELVGTPRYMAPEQWNGQDHAPADVWALGILLHILFTGVHPLPKELDAATLVRLVATDEPLPMSDEIARVPEPVQGLVRRCLSKDPLARPTAAEVAAMLDRGEPSLSHRLPTRRGPFPGLAAFDEDAALDFAGRADATDACATRLATQGLVVVTGPSGAGKSSLVAAGLVPRLRGLGPLRVVRIRGARPLLALARALEGGVLGLDEGATEVTHQEAASRVTTPEPAEALAERLRADPTSLAPLVLPGALARGERVLFFVDQLEEMLAPGVDRDELRAFLGALASAASASGPLHVVITVRDDHLGQVPFGELAGRFLAATMQLSPPDARALEQMITRPLTRAGYGFEDPAAPDRLAAALAGLAHALPLLQVALGRLWEARDRGARTIPRAATDALTDPLRILSEVADAQVDALEPAMLDTVRQLFVRLVTPERSRARVARGVLFEALGPAVDGLVARFAEAGILAITDTGEVELAHEAIIDRWDRLSSWLDQTDVVSAHAKEIEQRARQWEREGRSDEALLAGTALRASEALLGERTDRLTPLARELLERSRAVRARQRRLRLALRATLTASLLVALAAAVIAAWALSERESLANDARDRAERDRASLLAVSAAQRLAGGDLLGARALARASLESGDDLGTRSLVDQLREEPLRFRVPLGEVLYSAVRDPGSPVAWIASTSGDVLRLDTRTAELTALRGHSDQVTAVTRTHSGALVSVDWSGSVRRWEGDRSTEIARTSGDAPVQLVAAGDVVVIGTIAGGLVRLDPERGTTTPLTSARFSGRALDAHGELVWTARDGHVIAMQPLEDRVAIDLEIAGRIRALQVSPDGTRLAISSSDGRLVVHEVASRRELVSWSVGDECRRLLWIDERRLLAACGASLHHLDVIDRAWTSREVNGALLTDLALGEGDVVVTSILGAAVYDLAGLARPSALPVPRGIATASGVSVEHGLAFVGTPGWLHVIALDDARIVRAIELGGADAMREIVVTPDAVLVSRGSQVSRFSLPGLQRTHVFASASGQIEALALSGDRLVSGGRDGQVTEWSVATGLARGVVELGALVRDVVILDDGTWIAGTSGALVRGSLEGELERRAIDGTLLCLSRDAQGRLLAGTSEGRVLRFADLHAEPEVLVEIDARVYSVRATADARIAFASADRLARILSPDGSLRNLAGHRGEANSVAFSSDGEWLVSAGDDSTLRAWDTRTGAPRWATTGLAPGDPEPALTAQGVREDASGEVRCRHHEGRLTLSIAGATRASWDVGAVDDVAATSWACAVRVADRVVVHPASGEPSEVQGRARALAAAGDTLLAALEDVVVEVAASGATRPLGTTGAAASALVRTGDAVWWGDERGAVHALDADTTLEPAGSTAPVSHLAAGPAGTLVVGRTDGTIDVWDPAQRALLRSTRVHGAVVDSALAGAILHVVSELGHRARIDLTSTTSGWCPSLRELWQTSTLTWRDGALAAAEPPRDHPCAR